MVKPFSQDLLFKNDNPNDHAVNSSFTLCSTSSCNLICESDSGSYLSSLTVIAGHFVEMGLACLTYFIIFAT